MARKELTKSKAIEYKKATKKRKGEILDNLCEDTGWGRDNARRQLKNALTENTEYGSWGRFRTTINKVKALRNYA